MVTLFTIISVLVMVILYAFTVKAFQTLLTPYIVLANWLMIHKNEMSLGYYHDNNYWSHELAMVLWPFSVPFYACWFGFGVTVIAIYKVVKSVSTLFDLDKTNDHIVSKIYWPYLNKDERDSLMKDWTEKD
jgi:hypothetical protein